MTRDRHEDHRPNPDHLSSTDIRIGALSPDQWTALRDLKLRSLDQEPIAFADVDPERAKYLTRTEEEWRTILSGKMTGGRAGETVMLFAEDNGHYVGMVSAIIPEKQTTATIQHMYVDSEGYRGLGIGKQLLTTLLQQLRTRNDLQKAELTVVVTQTPARRLYESVGFIVIKTLEKSAVRGIESFDEVEMGFDL